MPTSSSTTLTFEVSTNPCCNAPRPPWLGAPVVGVPDADFGEVGVAVVVLLAGATVDPAQVIATLKSMLANFKVPKRCVVVAELPRNAMGKVQKNLLREQYRPA